MKKPTHALVFVSWPGRIDETQLGHATRDQRKHCRRYARANGYTVNGKHHGYTSTDDLLRKIKRSPHEKFVVVVDNISRISLNRVMFDDFCAKLRPTGARIESLDFNLQMPAKEQYQTLIRKLKSENYGK